MLLILIFILYILLVNIINNVVMTWKTLQFKLSKVSGNRSLYINNNRVCLIINMDGENNTTLSHLSLF